MSRVTRKHWSAEEDALLEQIYYFPVPVCYVADVFGRTVQAVRSRAKVIGLQREDGKTKRGPYKDWHSVGQKKWDPDELKILQKAVNMGVQYEKLRLLFRRDGIQSIYSAVKRYNITRPDTVGKKGKNVQVSEPQAELDFTQDKDTDFQTILDMLNEHIEKNNLQVKVFTDDVGKVRAKVITEIVY